MPQQCRPRVITIPAKCSYTLKIEINDTQPPVWRRLKVPGSLTLAEFHIVIQTAFGWTNSHLHDFSVGEKRYSDPRTMDGADELDENRFSLDGVLGARLKNVKYMYDFGDGWGHSITVEKRDPSSPEDSTPACLAGERACPPEDCGGPYGYEDLLMAAKKPKSKRYIELNEWLDLGLFDPDEFDLAQTNKLVANFRKSRVAMLGAMEL